MSAPPSYSHLFQCAGNATVSLVYMLVMCRFLDLIDQTQPLASSAVSLRLEFAVRFKARAPSQ
jgi:hypothetical protein